MKRTILLLTLIVSLIWSCNNSDEPVSEESSVLVLLIDYDTNEFQAGTSLFVPPVDFEFTELPVTADIQEPTADLKGSVSLALTSTNEQLFNGELSPAGDAIIFAPNFTGPGGFFMLIDELAYPTGLSVKDIEGPYNESFETTWEAIDKLNIIDLYLENDALVGRFLYKPSEDVPENWKWVIMFYEQ